MPKTEIALRLAPETSRHRALPQGLQPKKQKEHLQHEFVLTNTGQSQTEASTGTHRDCLPSRIPHLIRGQLAKHFQAHRGLSWSISAVLALLKIVISAPRARACSISAQPPDKARTMWKDGFAYFYLQHADELRRPPATHAYGCTRGTTGQLIVHPSSPEISRIVVHHAGPKEGRSCSIL